jgi:glutathione S-transferase
MKLYYAPGACSLSPHIALHEAGLAHESEKVDLSQKTLAGGGNYLAINPKGQVPALVIGKTVLTEGPAVVQYIADQAPQSGLAPANGTLERYQLQEWLNFITSDLHKTFTPLFKPNTPEDYKPIARENLGKAFAYVDQRLAGNDYLMGSQFTVADGYLFVVLRWADAKKIDISTLKNLTAFQARVAGRPGVKAALQAEGLA